MHATVSTVGLEFWGISSEGCFDLCCLLRNITLSCFVLSKAEVSYHTILLTLQTPCTVNNSHTLGHTSKQRRPEAMWVTWPQGWRLSLIIFCLEM